MNSERHAGIQRGGREVENEKLLLALPTGNCVLELQWVQCVLVRMAK